MYAKYSEVSVLCKCEPSRNSSRLALFLEYRPPGTVLCAERLILRTDYRILCAELCTSVLNTKPLNIWRECAWRQMGVLPIALQYLKHKFERIRKKKTPRAVSRTQDCDGPRGMLPACRACYGHCRSRNLVMLLSRCFLFILHLNISWYLL